jgi:membrane protease YdiL (CAAX protease family)
MTDSRTSSNSLQQWIQEHPIIAFPLVYLGWAYLFWTPLLLSESSVWEFPNIVWFLIGGASPLIAGLSLAAATGGTAQLLDLFHRLVDWRRIPGMWWPLVVSFWLVFDVSMAGLAVLLGVTDSPLDVNWSLFFDPGLLLFLLLLSFVSPAVEEVGLRGYYLDTLQRRLGPTAAGAVNGVAISLWRFF